MDWFFSVLLCVAGFLFLVLTVYMIKSYRDLLRIRKAASDALEKLEDQSDAW